MELKKIFYPLNYVEDYIVSSSTNIKQWGKNIFHSATMSFKKICFVNYFFESFNNKEIESNHEEIDWSLMDEKSIILEIPTKDNKTQDYIIGIDLGTTNSCVSVLKNGVCELIADEENNRITPSVVAYDKDQKIVGRRAKIHAKKHPESTLFSTKRFIGCKYDEVKSDALRQPYKVIKDEQGKSVFEIEGKIVAPEDAAAEILAKMKAIAEKHLKHEVSRAVVTVPAYFNDLQRQATRKAGKKAGLDVLRIISEPTAASLAYGIDKKSNKEQNVVVYDLGGGTFDVSVLNIDGGVFSVKSTNGDTHLGGDDFDNAIVDWMIQEFEKQNKIDLSNKKEALQRLKEAAIKAKVNLSKNLSTQITIKDIASDSSGIKKNLDLTLTRDTLELICKPLILKTIESCKKALSDAKLSVKQIDHVVLIGGMTRMPAIRLALNHIFGKPPNTSVNPDEAVAIGAAIQGGIIAGDIDNVLLLDIAPLSLGIETKGNVFTSLIQKNTAIPTKKTMKFQAADQGQKSVMIKVFQGERPMAQDNKEIGSFSLDVTSEEKKRAVVDVAFQIDANGILEVLATDLESGKEKRVKLATKSDLSKSDLKSIFDNAKKNEEDDQKRFQNAKAHNDAEELLQFAKESMEKEGSYKDILTPKVRRLEEAIEKNNTELLKTEYDQLLILFHADKFLNSVKESIEKYPKNKEMLTSKVKSLEAAIEEDNLELIITELNQLKELWFKLLF